MLVIQTSVTTRNTPGTKITHQEFVNNALDASDNIVPSDTISVGNPNPKKLNVASIVIEIPMEETITNKIGDKKLGNK